MKALIKDTGKPGMTVASVEVPEIGRREVLIRVEASALCKSDVDVYDWTPLVEKADYDLPFIMGHEFAGTIVKVGEDVQGYQEGDRVAGRPISPADIVKPAGPATSISAAITWGFWEGRWTAVLQIT